MAILELAMGGHQEAQWHWLCCQLLAVTQAPWRGLGVTREAEPQGGSITWALGQELGPQPEAGLSPSVPTQGLLSQTRSRTSSAHGRPPP